MTDIAYEWQELWPRRVGSITRDRGIPEIKQKGPIELAFDPLTPRSRAAKTSGCSVPNPLFSVINLFGFLCPGIKKKKSVVGVFLKETWSENKRAACCESVSSLISTQPTTVILSWNGSRAPCPEINTRSMMACSLNPTSLRLPLPCACSQADASVNERSRHQKLSFSPVLL